MKRFLCTAMFGCLIFLTGCGQRDRGMNLSSHLQDDVSGKAVFVSGMGCSDSNCTDPTHHHDCPPDCGDYEHYHNCDLNCTETSHHHNGADYNTDSTADTAESFVSGMGCSDPNCTDPTHHHDCPPDCGDYEHYHNCDLNCMETSHHHNGMSDVNESGQHHEEQHHGGDHH